MRRSEACTEPETAPCNIQHNSCVSPDVQAPNPDQDLLVLSENVCRYGYNGRRLIQLSAKRSFQPGPCVSRCLTVSTERTHESAFWTPTLVMNSEKLTEIISGSMQTESKSKVYMKEGNFNIWV